MKDAKQHTRGELSNVCISTLVCIMLIPGSFGVPAVLLELVPLFGIFFAFTNTVGAALWAADMEQKSAAGQDTTAPHLRNQAELATKSE